MRNAGIFLLLCLVSVLLASTLLARRRQQPPVQPPASVPLVAPPVSLPTQEQEPPLVASTEDEESNDLASVRDLDGETQTCTVYSGKSATNYTLDVDFEGEKACLHFPNGGVKYVDIDDPDSQDFTSIAATDHEGETWEITAEPPVDTSEQDTSDTPKEAEE